MVIFKDSYWCKSGVPPWESAEGTTRPCNILSAGPVSPDEELSSRLLDLDRKQTHGKSS